VSFIISVYVGEGIVLASDSRTTYGNTQTIDGQMIMQFGVHTTDTTDKTFLCPNGCGIATCGDATVDNSPITSKIQAFIREKITPDTSILDMPKLLVEYFSQLLSTLNTTFIIAGYSKENGKSYQKIYRVRFAGGSIEDIDTQHQGAVWDGESMTLIKLIQPVALKNPDNTYDDLPTNEISWNYFTLQDAVDYAKFAVETTINTMRFQNVVKTVGEPIDILVIQPENSYWLSKKELQ